MSTTTTTEAPTAASILSSCREKAKQIAETLDPISPYPKEAPQPAEPAGLLDQLRGLQLELAEIVETAARIRSQLGLSL